MLFHPADEIAKCETGRLFLVNVVQTKYRPSLVDLISVGSDQNQKAALSPAIRNQLGIVAVTFFCGALSGKSI